jgi:eukaryotic-like serine/threonine-protein kinase
MKPDPKSIRELFVAALAKVDPDHWDVFRAGDCGGDPELLGEVRLLLEAHHNAGSFLKSPVVDSAFAVDSGTSPLGGTRSTGTNTLEGAGTVIGPYKLLQPIGEGAWPRSTWPSRPSRCAGPSR